MSTHTKGPWRAEVVPFGTGKRVEVTATGSTGGRGVVVRLVSHVSGPYGEDSLVRRQADARLIAAAPELLSVAESVVLRGHASGCALGEAHCGLPVSGVRCDCLYEVARAALAKAEGRS